MLKRSRVRLMQESFDSELPDKLVKSQFIIMKHVEIHTCLSLRKIGQYYYRINESSGTKNQYK